MRISNLRIQNYRSIKDTGEISPTKLFALIGKNNSGKSTVIKAIQVLFAQDADPIKKTDFHKGILDDIEISASLTDFYDDAYAKLKKKDGTIEIAFKCSSSDLSPTYFLNGQKKSQKDIQELPELLVIPAIRNPQNESTAGSKSILKGLISLISKQQRKQKSTTETISKEIVNIKLSEATEEQIKAALEEKNKEQIIDVSEKINETFRSVIADSSLKIEISPEVDLSKGITYWTKIIDSDIFKNTEDGINLMSCGTGLQSIFILSLLETYANVAECNDSILLIEEPEVYLHPEFQRKMFAALRKIASANQVIYTTHSPIMISELWADESVKLVRLEGGKTLIEKIDIETVISELGIKYEDVLNAKVVVFVEGDEDVDFFKKIVYHLKPELSGSLDRRIKFIPSDGYRNINSYAYIKIIYSANVDAEFYIIADSDGRSPEKRQKELVDGIKNKIGKIGKKIDKQKLLERITILKEHAIESYLLNADLLNSVFPDITKQELTEMIDFYRNKYETHIEKIKKDAVMKKKDQEKFQGVFRSKNIFTNDKLKKPKAYENFSILFENNSKFLETRNKIVNKCKEINITRQSIIAYILSKADFSKEIFKEPMLIIKGILDKTEN